MGYIIKFEADKYEGLVKIYDENMNKLELCSFNDPFLIEYQELTKEIINNYLEIDNSGKYILKSTYYFINDTDFFDHLIRLCLDRLDFLKIDILSINSENIDKLFKELI